MYLRIYLLTHLLLSSNSVDYSHFTCLLCLRNQRGWIIRFLNGGSQIYYPCVKVPRRAAILVFIKNELNLPCRSLSWKTFSEIQVY